MKTYYFVHINKTGGTSIRQKLGIPMVDSGVNTIHKTARDFISRVGLIKWNQRFTFAFVRNPWDKVVSQYHHQLKAKVITKPITFQDWVVKHFGHKAPKHKKMFSPQLSWITYQDNIVVDFIGRFENLQSDFQLVCKQLNVDKTLPHLNKSKHKHYREYYNPKTKMIIARWFKDDINHFKYQF